MNKELIKENVIEKISNNYNGSFEVKYDEDSIYITFDSNIEYELTFENYLNDVLAIESMLHVVNRIMKNINLTTTNREYEDPNILLRAKYIAEKDNCSLYEAKKRANSLYYLWINFDKNKFEAWLVFNKLIGDDNV